jgi:hypothetical protein
MPFKAIIRKLVGTGGLKTQNPSDGCQYIGNPNIRQEGSLKRD